LITKHSLPHPDAVFAFEILEHLENPEKLLQEIYKLLSKGGTIILSVPNEKYEPKKKGKPKNKFHKQLFTEYSISTLILQSGFTINGIYSQPYSNTLYHFPKWIGKTLDYLTNTFPTTFPFFAARIATPQLATPSKSYSIIIVAEKL
jgi:SAM-dependent methyltransferase